MPDESSSPLLLRLDAVYRNALNALHAGQIDQCMRSLQIPYSSDSLLSLYEVGGADELADAIAHLTAHEDIGLAASELVDERVMQRQCQLDLLRAIVAMFASDMSLFVDAIASVCDRASFLDRVDDEKADGLAEAAIALNPRDATSCARLAIWSAKRHVANRNWQRARAWLARVDWPHAGPLAESAKSIRGLVEHHLTEGQVNEQ